MKLTTTTFVFVDGVMQGIGSPDEDRSGGFTRGGWATPLFDKETATFVNQVYQRADAFLFGRRTYEIFAGSWGVMADPGDNPIAVALNTRPSMWHRPHRYRGLPLYVDESEYQDTDGTMKPFVPEDNVLVAASSLVGNFSYSGVAQVDADESRMSVYQSKRVPLIFYEAGEDIRKFRLSTRPIPVPQNLAAWTVLDAL